MRSALAVLGTTYAFWAVFWALCFSESQTLGAAIMLIFPPAMLVAGMLYVKSLVLPVGLAVAAAGFALKRAKSRGAAGKAVAVNAAFLATFLLSGQLFFALGQRIKAVPYAAECASYTPFIASVAQLDSTPTHAALFKGNHLYQWSYKQFGYYENTRASQVSLRKRMCERRT